MDYTQLIIDGYIYDNNRRNLQGYFTRQLKIAERGFIHLNDFHAGCVAVLSRWEELVLIQIKSSQNQLKRELELARNGKIRFSQIDPGKTYEQMCEESINRNEEELLNIDSNKWVLHLKDPRNPDRQFHITKKEIGIIKSELTKAHNLLTLVGFDYSIPEREPWPTSTLEEIFKLSSREKILSGKMLDFVAIFGGGGEVRAPLTWLITSQKGKGGHKQSLLYFIKLMFRGQLQNDVKRATSKLFIDTKGEFFLKPQDNLSLEGFKQKSNEFEEGLLKILGKN